jgi:HNH endonuclease
MIDLTIIRTANGYAVLDTADALRLGTGNIRVRKGYPTKRRRRGGIRREIALHRLIMGLETTDSREVDHINRNRLDCRGCNLQVVSRLLNAQNRDSFGQKWKHSGKYRGVHWDSTNQRWRAVGIVNGIKRTLVTTRDEDEAGSVIGCWRTCNMPNSDEARRHRGGSNPDGTEAKRPPREPRACVDSP